MRLGLFALNPGDQHASPSPQLRGTPSTRLAFKLDQLDACEQRSLITDPIGLSAMSLGIPLIGNVITSSDGGGGSPEAR